jgi:hypothetical protein
MRRLLSLTCAAAVALAPTAVRAEDKPDAKTIIEKAIKAHGGADKIDKVKATVVKTKGTVHVMGMDIAFTGTNSSQEPDKMRVEVDVTVMGMDFKSTQIFNKDKAWVGVNGTFTEVDKDMVKLFQEKMYGSRVGRLTPLLKDKEFKLSVVGESKIGDKEAVGIRVECKDHADITLYFDKKTNRLIKTEGREKDPMSGEEVNQEVFLEEYKDKDGIPVPHKVTVKRDGKDFVEAEVTDHKVEEKLDDSLFDKP